MPCGISSGRARSRTTRSPRSARSAGSGRPGEAVASEGIEGGFSAVYPILRALEDAGRIRRGYFIDGLGAAQFALAGAVERLRAVRDGARDSVDRDVVLLAASDPANPYGAAIPWPRRDDADRRPYQRAAGASVVLVDGLAVIYVDRGGGSIQMLPAAEDGETAVEAARGLAGLLADARARELVITKIDGEPVAASRFRDVLVAAGFTAGYRGLVLRRAVERPSSGGPLAAAPGRGGSSRTFTFR
jgi:ATP-dependent Lhr-like helicase